MIQRTIKSLVYKGLQRAQGQTKGRILLSCFPKSGSTYTSNVIAELFGLRKMILVPTAGRREQEIDLMSLQEINPNQKFIAQHHVRFHPNTQRLSADYNLSNVFLTRNIFDAMVSLRDHIRNESVVMPFAYLCEYHQDLDDCELDCLIADLVVPWYFNFFVSWYYYPNKLHVTYEEMQKDEYKYFKKILEYAELQFSLDAVTEAIDVTKQKNSNRLNKGVMGRGESLCDYSRGRIITLSRHYADIDFRSVGID